ncbi:ribosome small subunit-dependent GTPase A [Actinomycetospora cinnamomea]|uniref:Small ribosomal subunit biogenesis GTPase RsgA n=1 Tax=Actinomycetospora cinnamomea TaxID=663609 RepID=A0A2U1F8Q6_9PSEU|nr:ribosome small subunit-dependent GTPase A [Actinomycetospora cinnamomea]PVZ08561.1 ribosome biogenesis GTPase [Actinomycetospora cinnamomea]
MSPDLSPDPAPVLCRYGWDASWAQLALAHLESGHVPGRVARVDRGRVDVHTEHGRLRAAPGREVPAVGDWVVLASSVVTAVLPRRTVLTRADASGRSEGQVLAANVDTVLIAVPAEVGSRPGRVERLLALAWESGATPVVVLTKVDGLEDSPAAVADLALAAPGAEVVAVSAVTGEGLDVVAAAAARGTTVLVGPSGAGKSTLANALLGEEVLAVGEVRARDGKGRHTTAHRELVALPSGGVLIDTPGLRAVGVRDAAEGIDRAFTDVVDLADACRFADCAHDHEPGCAVRAAVEAGELPARRWAAYRKLVREDEWAAARTDARLAAERRARWKSIAKAQRAAYRERGR